MRYAPSDIIKAVCLLLMPVDHFRDFFCRDVIASNDMTGMALGLYLFRSVTIWGAIAFNFTAGMSIAFVMGKTAFDPRARTDLAKRGLVLIVLNVLVAYPLLHQHVAIGLSVLTSLGVSMIVIAYAIPRGGRFLSALAVGIYALHTALPFFPALDAWLYPLHHQCTYLLFGVPVVVLYPVLPWIAIMIGGYLLGASVLRHQGLAARHVGMGAGLVAAFALLRFVNVAGETTPWVRHDTVGMTLKSFFNLSKYPPSLDACLLYGGIIVLMLYGLQRMPGRETVHRLLSPFARVPMFIYLYHLAAGALIIGVWLAAGIPPLSFGWTAVFAFAFMAASVPVFTRYDRYKQAHKDSFLKYL